MRNEKEMYELILNTAESDERIRAVYMNGSRTNENVPTDIFQDYDIVYVVTDTKPFIDDKTWIDRFGDRLFMQYPDESPDELPPIFLSALENPENTCINGCQKQNGILIWKPIRQEQYSPFGLRQKKCAVYLSALQFGWANNPDIAITLRKVKNVRHFYNM